MFAAARVSRTSLRMASSAPIVSPIVLLGGVRWKRGGEYAGKQARKAIKQKNARRNVKKVLNPLHLYTPTDLYLWQGGAAGQKPHAHAVGTLGLANLERVRQGQKPVDEFSAWEASRSESRSKRVQEKKNAVAAADADADAGEPDFEIAAAPAKAKRAAGGAAAKKKRAPAKRSAAATAAGSSEAAPSGAAAAAAAAAAAS